MNGAGDISDNARGKQPASPTARTSCAENGSKRKSEGGSPSSGNPKHKKKHAHVASTEVGQRYDKADLVNIKAHYEKFGVVIVSGLLTPDQCNELILEQWAKIILAQDYTDEYKLKITDEDGRVLDPTVDADKPKFLEQVTGPLSTEKHNKFKAGLPKHVGFGAGCDPSVWHLEKVWALRQDPCLYKVAKTICNERKLWVTICRQVHVLLGMAELLHWDRNMYKAWLESFSGAPKELEELGVQAKACYSEEMQFICVPETHTNEFLQDFHEQYGPHYDQLMKDHNKFGLSTDKPDPMNLFGKKVKLIMMQGDFVFWDRGLLHGTEVNTSKKIKYGSYIGFNGAVSRAAYKKASGVDELTDRLASFEKGMPPICYGSCDKVHVFPELWKSHGKRMLADAVKKLPDKHASIYDHVQKNGTVVQYLKFLPQTNYVKPTLSELGKRLLGELPYGEHDESDGEGAAPVVAVPAGEQDTESDSESEGEAKGAAGAAAPERVVISSDEESEEDLFAPAKAKGGSA